MPPVFRTNLFKVSAKYLQELRIPVTNTSLKESLEQNPYYPSLLSLSKVFDNYGINSQAFEIENEDIDRFQPPFIAYINTPNNGDDFVLITKMGETSIQYFPVNDKTEAISKEDFIKNFKKIVFVAEGNNESGETGYAQKLHVEKKLKARNLLLYASGLLLLGLVSIIFFNKLVVHAFLPAVLLVAKLAGLLVTGLLLVWEIDKTNNFVKNICTAGKQTNCDAVLKSKAGKIAGITWSEIGFFYFAATTLFLLFPGMAFEIKLPWLIAGSLLAAPYTFFSIYYQWKVVKQWCPLCLAVQAVLLIESSLAIYDIITTNISFDLFLLKDALISFLFCMLLPVITWFLFKPFILKAVKAPLYEASYKRLLFNPGTFNYLLQQQRNAPPVESSLSLGIVFGDPNAKNTIIKVCGPYCGPCAKAHPILEEIVRHKPHFNLRVIFSIMNIEKDERGAKVIRHLLAIQSQNDSQRTEKALNDWYSAPKKDYDAFAAKYPINEGFEMEDEKIKAMGNWCKEAKITHTPTIFINGRQLPEDYSINELNNVL